MPHPKSLLPAAFLLAVPISGCDLLDEWGESSGNGSDSATSTSDGDASTSGSSSTTSSAGESSDETASSESTGTEGCSVDELIEEIDNSYPEATICDLPLGGASPGDGIILDGIFGSFGTAFSLSETCTVAGVVFPSPLLDDYTRIELDCTTAAGMPVARDLDAPIAPSIEAFAPIGAEVHLERVVEGTASFSSSNGWIGLYNTSDKLIVGFAALGTPESLNAPADCAAYDPSCAFFRPLAIGTTDEVCPPEPEPVCISPCFHVQRMGVVAEFGDTTTVVGDQAIGSVTSTTGKRYDISVGIATQDFDVAGCDGTVGQFRYVFSRVQ